MTKPLKQPLMVCIERICRDCGASNRIVTPEIQPTWNINCSKCGAVVVERQRFRPRLVDGPDGAWLPV